MTVHKVPESILSGLSPATGKSVHLFIGICRDLAIIIRNENKEILANSSVTLSSGFYARLALMKKFEEEINTVMKMVNKEASDNKWLHLYLLNEIGILRNAFKINTALYMEDIKRRAIRISDIKERLISSASSVPPEKAESSCH